MSRSPSKLRRIQDLLTEGKVLDIPADGETIRLWIAKPTAFERDEAASDGRSARALRSLKFDADEGEQAILTDRLKTLGRDKIVEGLAQAKSNDFYLQAMDEINADPEWNERMEALRRGQALIDDAGGRLDVTDEDERSRLGEELELLRQLNTDYLVHLDGLIKKFTDEHKAELTDLTEDKLDAEYRKAWREMAGSQAFMTERRITELWYAVRDCEGVEDEAGKDGFNHSRCNGHLRKLAEFRHEVNAFPDILLVMAREVLEDLNMSPQDAAFSDAPTSSSASSERPSEAAESEPSTPVETSPEPVGT